MSKKFKGKACVYCATAGAAETADHVLAREFVPVAHRAQIPKVPACRACNGKKAELEHYLATVIPFGGRHADASTNLKDNAPRRLAKNQKLHRTLARGSSLPDLAVDLVRGRPSVIVTNTLPAALAAKAATSAVPVVFVIGEDPIKAGLVASLNRPDANVTGVTNFMNVLGAKRMELASEIVPTAAQLALLVNQNNPNAEADTADLRTASDALGRKLLVLTASSDAEIEAAFAAGAQQKVGALFVNIDPFFANRRGLFAALASRYAVPTVYPLRDFVAAGGLMSYGANFADAWRQAGAYAARILRGAKPADLPVLQPTKIELVINLNAAKALGLNIPAKLLALADEVIE